MNPTRGFMLSINMAGWVEVKGGGEEVFGCSRTFFGKSFLLLFYKFTKKFFKNFIMTAKKFFHNKI